MSKEKYRVRKRGAEQQQINRRRFLKLGLVGLGAATAAGLAIALNTEDRIKPQDIIEEEIKRRNIQQDSEEKELWNDSYQYKPSNTQLNDETARTVSNLFFDTLERMRESKNVHFSSSANYLLGLNNEKRVSFSIFPNLGEKHIDGLATSLTVQEGKAAFRFEISADFILNTSSSLTLAPLITHEIEHMKRFEQIVNQMPQEWSDEQRGERLTLMGQQRENNITEEKFAYAKGAEAYITQWGLLGGIPNTQITGLNERAAMYAHYGSDPNNENWGSYIESILYEN